MYQALCWVAGVSKNEEGTTILGLGLPRCAIVKNLPINAGETGDVGSIPRSGRSPGKGNGNPLQCSCLENSMDRGA